MHNYKLMAPHKRKANSTEDYGPASTKRSTSPRVKLEPDIAQDFPDSIVTRPGQPLPSPSPSPLPSDRATLVGIGSRQSPPKLPALQIFCPNCFSCQIFHASVPLHQAPWPAFTVPVLIPLIPGFSNQSPETVSVSTFGTLSKTTTTTERLSNGTTVRETTVFTNSPSMIYYRFTPTISVALASTTTNVIITPIHPPGPPKFTRQVKVHSFIHTCRALPTCPAGSPCPWVTRNTRSVVEENQSDDEGLGKDEC